MEVQENDGVLPAVENSIPANVRTALRIAYLSVFVDMLGVSIILPIIPFLAKQYGATSQDLGIVYAAYAVAQMVGISVSGRMADKFGRRPMLLLSLFGSCGGFLFQGLANTLQLLIAARFCAGIFGGSIPIADSLIATVVPMKSRPRYYGMLGTCVTVAFMVGPGIGAGLAEFTLATPMFVSAGLAGMGFVAAVFWYNDQVPQRPGTGTTDNATGAQAGKAAEAAGPPEYKKLVWLMWLVSFCSMLGFSSYIYFFGLFMLEQFGWGALEYGFASMSLSIFAVVVQITLVGKITDRLGKHATACASLLLQCVGFALLPVAGGEFDSAQGWPVVIGHLTLIGFAYSCGPPSVSSLLSRYAPPGKAGTVLGTSKALQGLARAVGPLVYGALFDSNRSLPFFLAGGVSLLGSLTVFSVLQFNRRLPEHSDRQRGGSSADPLAPHTGGVSESADAQLEDTRYLLEAAVDDMEAEKLRALVTALRAAVHESLHEPSNSGVHLDAVLNISNVQNVLHQSYQPLSTDEAEDRGPVRGSFRGSKGGEEEGHVSLSPVAEGARVLTAAEGGDGSGPGGNDGDASGGHAVTVVTVHRESAGETVAGASPLVQV